MTAKPAVLFVCLGNICRSPLAEAAFRREAEQAGLDAEIDSAGTGHWHIGEAPDRRARAVALRHGADIGSYRARQVIPARRRRQPAAITSGSAISWHIGMERVYPASNLPSPRRP